MSEKEKGGTVVSFTQKKVEKMGQGALIQCPCGQQHLMALDERRTCGCGRYYGYVEDEKALQFMASIGISGDGRMVERPMSEETRRSLGLEEEKLPPPTPIFKK